MMVRFSYIFFIIAEETPDNTETMIQLLVDAGADVNHKDNEGYTPLMINGNYWVVTILLQMIIMISHSHKLQTITYFLFFTAKERYRYRNEIEQKDLCVAALIKNGADFDYQNSKGEYALLIAGKT